MSVIADLIRAGVDPELVEKVANEIASAKTEAAMALIAIAQRRRADADRQARHRHAMSRDIPSPSETKERSPPTPPSKEKLNLPYPLFREADASPVDGSNEINELASKDSKALTAEVRTSLRFLGEQWNATAAPLRLPLIDEIESGSTRERHALARLHKLASKFPTREAGVDALMARIRGSPLLRGEVNGWRCSFDWIINASNFQKVMDGNYENCASAGQH